LSQEACGKISFWQFIWKNLFQLAAAIYHKPFFYIPLEKQSLSWWKMIRPVWGFILVYRVNEICSHIDDIWTIIQNKTFSEVSSITDVNTRNCFFLKLCAKVQWKVHPIVE
jgi:hypothetical protein